MLYKHIQTLRQRYVDIMKLQVDILGLHTSKIQYFQEHRETIAARFPMIPRLQRMLATSKCISYVFAREIMLHNTNDVTTLALSRSFSAVCWTFSARRVARRVSASASAGCRCSPQTATTTAIILWGGHPSQTLSYFSVCIARGASPLEIMT